MGELKNKQTKVFSSKSAKIVSHLCRQVVGRSKSRHLDRLWWQSPPAGKGPGNRTAPLTCRREGNEMKQMGEKMNPLFYLMNQYLSKELFWHKTGLHNRPHLNPNNASSIYIHPSQRKHRKCQNCCCSNNVAVGSRRPLSRCL